MPAVTLVSTTPFSTKQGWPVKSVTGCAGSGLLSSGMTEPVMWWLIVPSGWITNWILHENTPGTRVASYEAVAVSTYHLRATPAGSGLRAAADREHAGHQ